MDNYIMKKIAFIKEKMEQIEVQIECIEIYEKAKAEAEKQDALFILLGNDVECKEEQKLRRKEMEKEKTVKEQSHKMTLEDIQAKQICVFGIFIDPKRYLRDKSIALHTIDNSPKYKKGVKYIIEALTKIKCTEEEVDQMCIQNNFYEVKNEE